MSYQLPVDFAAHVGQDVTFRDLLRAAWVACRRHGRQALGYGVLWYLLTLAGVGAASMLAMAIAVPVALATMRFGPGAMKVATIFSTTVGAVFAAAATGLLVFPLLAGYLWSIARTYDARRMQAGDLFDGFRRQKYKMLLILGLLQGAASAAIQVAATVLSLASLSGGAGGWTFRGLDLAQLATRATIWGMSTAGGFIVTAAFLLTYYFAFAHPAPTWGICLEHNWRVLRARPGHFLLVVFFPLIFIVGLLLVLGLPGLGLGFVIAKSGAVVLQVLAGLAIAALALVFLLCLLALYVYWAFLWAGFFRTSYGYTLYPPAPGEGLRSGALAAPSIMPGRRRAEPGFDPGAYLPQGGPAGAAPGGPEAPLPSTDMPLRPRPVDDSERRDRP